jgi:hypothetical protein
MAPLQFWIRGDLRADQRSCLREIGVEAIPTAAGDRQADSTLTGVAWTLIVASAG